MKGLGRKKRFQVEPRFFCAVRVHIMYIMLTCDSIGIARR